MSEMIYLPVDRLHPHPDNPRKDLGDLSELADSIKANGIFQNLTVVAGRRVTQDEFIQMAKLEGVTREVAIAQYKDDPSVGDISDGYTVVIGHRRLAAAKMAGLTEVPCVIAEMTPHAQVKTMLMENIQRSDLTVYEQAQGFQLMLDMGETVESIAKDSGFSRSTIRRRVKLLDLDPKEFKNSAARGATLFDYMELDKVSDLKEKNKLLKVIGTPDFKAKLEKALNDQKKAARLAYIEETLSTFAKKVETPADVREWSYVTGPDYWSDTPIEIPEDAKTREYMYILQPWGCKLYRKKDKADLDAEAARDAAWKESRDRSKAREAAVKEVSDRCLKLRRDFVMNLSATACKKLISAATAQLLISGVAFDISLDGDDLDLLCPSLKTDEDFDPENLTIDQIIKALGSSEQTIVRLAYQSVEPGDGYYRRWGEYEYAENEALDMCYAFLDKLGYEISEEEKAFQNGTHEIFQTGVEQK